MHGFDIYEFIVVRGLGVQHAGLHGVFRIGRPVSAVLFSRGEGFGGGDDEGRGGYHGAVVHPERREEADLAPEILRTDLRDVEHPRRDIVKGNSVLDVIRPVFRNTGALDGRTVFARMSDCRTTGGCGIRNSS